MAECTRYLLRCAPNDVRRLAPGVHFVRERLAESGRPSAVFVRKVVMTKLGR